MFESRNCRILTGLVEWIFYRFIISFDEKTCVPLKIHIFTIHFVFRRQLAEFFFSKKFVKWKHVSIRATLPIQLKYYNPLNFKWFTLPILQFLQACRWPLLKIWPSVHPRLNRDPNIDLIPLYQYSHHTRESQLWINCITLRYWFW